jgi:ADP-ribose pyrophosphatase YjhB (NUDIX family)
MAGANGRRSHGHRLPRVDETSAGGLVVADHDRPPHALLIGRTDRQGRLVWSLPKGHIESGESPAAAAVREITEETGILAKVVTALGTIDFWFVADGQRVHKTVHHFLLRPVGGSLSTADHEVTDVAWVPMADLADRLQHADERRLAQRAIALTGGASLAGRATVPGNGLHAGS